jgi:hypothetical protein
LAVRLCPAEIARDSQEWLSYKKIEGGDVPPPSKLPGGFHLTDWLERELQADLQIALASRTDPRTAGCHVGRGAPAAEAPATSCCRGVIAYTIAIRSAVRIGGNGVIEQVEDFKPELGAVPLLEREGLEYREIHVLVARVAEDVPAHIAECSRVGRSYDRVEVVGYEAAIGAERTVEVGGVVHGRTLRPHHIGIAGVKGARLAGDAAGLLATASSPAGAEDKGVRTRPEVGGVAEDIPAFRSIIPPIRRAAATAGTQEEILVTEVGYLPRLGALDAHDGVELPAFQ